MPITSLLRAADTVSSARSAIRKFDLSTGREILDNQQISDLANSAINSAGNPKLSLDTLQEKLSRVASPYANALNTVKAALPALSPVVSLIAPGIGNIVNPISSLVGAISSGNADKTLLGLIDPKSNSPFTLGQGSGGTSGPILGNPTNYSFSTSRLPNPLRNYASFNYVISIGILSRSQNNSPNSTYRSSGLSKVILSSGGGNYTKRQTTATEDTFGPHGEYYIEDLEVDTLISHNPLTGAANATNFNFKIIEPYSMGQFLESCAGAAIESGYNSFTSAVYCLEISFVGFDDNSQVVDTGITPKYLPFMFTDIQFEASGEGCTYSIEAIPQNEQTTVDQVQEIKTDSNLRGETVAELLQTNPFNSLTNVMNSRIETQEEVGVLSKGDRYIICFPPQGRDIQEAVDDVTARFERTGSTGASAPTSVDTSSLAGITAASNASGGGLYESLKSWANNPANISSIGNSRLVLDVNEEGDRPSAFADLSIDIENVLRPVQRNAAATQMTDNERNFQITQGTKIMEVIADSIIHSEYGRTIIEGPNQQGQFQWYKVDLKTYVELEPTTERLTGNDAKVYVYQVTPFLVDESFFMGPSRRSTATSVLTQNALKTYNYLYTGKNEDVLDFQIEYKMAFFEAMAADLGQLSADSRQASATETTDVGKQPDTNRSPIGIGSGSPQDPNEPAVNQREVVENNANNGIRPGQSGAAKRRVANMFNKALTDSITDLIQADLQIMGDPYFIPDSGMGNFTDSAVPGAPGVTQGGTIETLNQETFILINFRLPYDYDANTGLMTFSRVQRQFSGLYEVISILNRFSDGQFTQTLNLIRRRSQSDEGTGETPMIGEDSNKDLSEGGNNEFEGPGGPTGGRDTERNSNDSGVQQGAQGGTGGAVQGSSPTITPTGPPTGTTPPSISYHPEFNKRTRNKSIQPQLLNILQSAAEAAGVRVEIWSGGQDIIGQGSNRTGSRRHDAGFAADVDLYDGNNRLGVNDPEDLAKIQTFIRAAKEAGATGVGAGNGYMGDERYHIDIADGNSLQPGMDGYGARYWGTSAAVSDGAPAWLRSIMR